MCVHTFPFSLSIFILSSTHVPKTRQNKTRTVTRQWQDECYLRSSTLIDTVSFLVSICILVKDMRSNVRHVFLGGWVGVGSNLRTLRLFLELSGKMQQMISFRVRRAYVVLSCLVLCVVLCCVVWSSAMLSIE
jgi:hypothetical protein